MFPLSQATEIRVRTGARLHFGPLSYQPLTGRHFGGIGVMIDQPGWEIWARSGPEILHDHVRGLQSDRALALLQKLRDHAPGEWSLAPVELDLRAEIPPHRGLGSGTQLALAIGRAVTRLNQIQCSTLELAAVLGRGLRSAIGLQGFDQGGFLIDAGQEPEFGVGELAWQTALPAAWRFLLLCPPGAISPFSGRTERSVFQSLTPMPMDVSGQLARIVLTDMLPALRNADCGRFGAALERYGELVGTFFSPWQGGVFADPQVLALTRSLRREGACGFAQSSWGPTVALLCPHQAQAELWAEHARQLTAGTMETHIVGMSQGTVLIDSN